MNINQLIELYQSNRNHYLASSYNETQLRNDFLDRLFEIFGWDIKNTKGKSTNEREVILEESLRAGITENNKKPDYTFRLYSERKFFLEAKKTSVNIQYNADAAKQIRRYGFTAKLKISVLSNFEYLVIYDCSEKVEETDNEEKGRIDIIHYTEYASRFEDLKKYLGRESVYSGKFDDEWSHIEEKIKRFSIDNLFLSQINEWRKLLGSEIYKFSPNLSSEKLNDYVQSYLNSIIFLRVCEDRNLEQYQTLLQLANLRNFEALIRNFEEADRKYNAGLFNQYLSEQIIQNISSAFWEIIQKLYYPESSYSFSVFSSDILGNIYEIFLSEKLIIENGSIKLVKKPEHVDRDIITTPTYIIQNILKETVIPYCKGKTASELLRIKISDLMCGSGAFLLETFQLLNDLLIDFYLLNSPEILIQTNIDTYKLPFNIKKTLLINCIYGNDKDYNAVQAAKFGLLLKLLEGEDNISLPSQRSVLPDLSHNITYGNSLINFTEAGGANQDVISQINPYDFTNSFDIIVGNPPYMMSEDMKNITPEEYKLYPEIYQSAYKQYDKYYLFIERGISYLKENGLLGYIVPSKFMKIGAGKELRRLLACRKIVFKIVSFGANQVFDNKTNYTCLLFLKNSINESLRFYEVRKLNEWKVRMVTDSDFEQIPNELSEKNWILLPSDLREGYNSIFEQSILLKDIVGNENIFNGIQTSANNIYVINNFTKDTDYIYFTKNNTNYKIEKELTKPYFETSSGIDNLYTYRLFKPNSLVIYPYRKINDIVELINIQTLQSDYPFLYNYLFEHYAILNERDIKPEPLTSEEWYRYGRSQSLDKLIVPIKLIVGVLSVGDKYAIDKYGTFISSGGTAGYCAIILPSDSHYSIYYLQAVLNSKYVEWICTLIGDVFRGGYFAHGTSVLKQLPIRKIDFNNLNEVSLHNEIADIQQTLISTKTDIDNNINNERERIKFERIFARLKSQLDSKLKELYSLGEVDSLIPTIKDLFETD